MSPTEDLFSPWSSSHCYVISLASSRNFLPPFTYKQTARLRGKIVRWKPNSEFLSNLNKMIEHSFFPWRSLPITTPKMPAPTIYLSSLIVNITLGFFTKKTSIPTQCQKPQKTYFSSSKTLWLFTSKISTTPKNFRSELIIRKSSLEAMLWVTRYSWLASTLEQSGIASWKPSFSVLFEHYI